MGATHRLSVVVLVSVASAFPTPLWGGASTQPEILDNDMHKLNEYLQAEKAASTNSVFLPIRKHSRLHRLLRPHDV